VANDVANGHRTLCGLIDEILPWAPPELDSAMMYCTQLTLRRKVNIANLFFTFMSQIVTNNKRGQAA
jgi:hypothetical protein